ncbi:MAG TPA: FAD-dependent oxidoreductase [Pyrinomonadaceae bacterium]|nr:FAD-dependent oxidoreductase [Pyrinomonadaceae bacterium]
MRLLRRSAVAKEKKRVVILGGGFAGVYTARYLEKALGRRGDFEVVLVNKENYFVFQPLLAEVVSGAIGVTDAVSPLRRLLPRTELHVREVESVDLKRRTVTTAPGFLPHPHVLKYDHLVLALGSVTDFRGMRGVAEHALPFKNLGDALRIRNHVIHALEEASIESDYEPRRRLLTFVVAGGGFSGVEVVAELNDFVREAARSYRQINAAEIRVVLLHAGARILPEVTERLGLFAQRLLRRRGVEIHLNTRLHAATGVEAILEDGRRIPTRTLVSTVPSSPHPLVESLELPRNRAGRLLANSFLEVEGAEGLWALGDNALVPLAGGQGSSPPTAQHATRQAKVAAHNIAAAIRGGEKREFSFKELGKLGALGRRSAVAEVFGVPVAGLPAWLMWRAVYLSKMPGWGRRLKVAASWALDVLLPTELAQLKLDDSAKLSKEHFEPGQEVFAQGDLGDRVYIIVRGRAAVLREEGGRTFKLAVLGPGEFFGEMAVLGDTTRNATVRAVEALDVVALPKREFMLVTSNLPDARQRFGEVVRRRRRAAAVAFGHPI